MDLGKRMEKGYSRHLCTGAIERGVFIIPKGTRWPRSTVWRPSPRRQSEEGGGLLRNGKFKKHGSGCENVDHSGPRSGEKSLKKVYSFP